MERSIKNAVQAVLRACVNAEYERIADDYVIGCDRDCVDGRIVREDVLYDEEALEEAVFSNVREEIMVSKSILDMVSGNRACMEAMPELLERYEACGSATEELRAILLEVLDEKGGW